MEACLHPLASLEYQQSDPQQVFCYRCNSSFAISAGLAAHLAKDHGYGPAHIVEFVIQHGK